MFNDLDVPSFNSDLLMLPPKPLPPVNTNSRIPRNVSSAGLSTHAQSVPFSRSLSFTRAPQNSMVRSYSFVKNGPDTANLMTMSMDQSSLVSRLAPVYQPSPVIGRRSLDRQRSRDVRGKSFRDQILISCLKSSCTKFKNMRSRLPQI